MNFDAFVLAAGLGTRLRPLTLHRPKPLVPVCGVPMLAYSLALCARHGLRDVVVNAHWLAEQLEAWEGDHEGVRVRITTERPEILGTGGGLRAVRDRLAPTFAVVNSDVLCDVDLSALIAAVPEGGAAMALRRHPEEAPRYGVVAADSASRIVDLVGLASAAPEGTTRRDTHFTGLHAMDRATLELVPEGFACIVRTAYRTLVPRRAVSAAIHEGIWLDVGDPEAYLDANLRTLRGLPNLPLDPQARAAFAIDARGEHGANRPDATLRGHVWIGHRARVDGAHVEDSIIGDHASVTQGASVRHCVVWDGATVPAGDHQRTIFYEGGALTLS